MKDTKIVLSSVLMTVIEIVNILNVR